MLQDLNSLQRYVSRALRQSWEDHRNLGDRGRTLGGIPDSFGRQETCLALQARLHLYAAVTEWCKAPGLGVRVYTPGGVLDCGDLDNLSCSLWFSGLWGAQVYEAFALEDRIAGRTPGYGIAYAVAEGIDPTFWKIRGAGMVRLDTGETLGSGDGSGTWLNKYVNGDERCQPTPITYSSVLWQSHTVVLADTQFWRRTGTAIPVFDTGSSFGNVFHMLTGQPVSIKGAATSVTSAIAACGSALPAVYYLLRGCGGDMFFPGFEHGGSQTISSRVDDAVHCPAVFGFSASCALEIVGNLK
ncbi:MAG TPA: hypothetical protein VM581_04495 [Magnetospirillaceae bacterium]|nr:hypothetical protein [Magnetospirillaceae bacterium]